MNEPLSLRSSLPLLTSEEMRSWDRRVIERLGVPERVLMESAGRAAARVLHALYPTGRVVAAVGPGNNGGDALVLLRTLRAWGREVAAVLVGRAEIREELLHGWELEVVESSDAALALGTAGVLVDGILGTGSSGAPRAAAAAMVQALNQAGPPIVALDGPTGVDLTTGEAPGEAVRAAVTVAFGAAKRGLVLFPGRRLAGRVVVVETGFPPPEAGDLLITDGWARRHAPRLPVNAHKGDRGKLVVVAGHPGMAGAAILVATGALRAGVGGVRIVSPSPNRAPLQTALPEALFVDRASAGLQDVLRSASALVVGPGMGTDEEALSVLREVVELPDVPVLLDADAITLLSKHPDRFPERLGPRFLLTPHPGEASRLVDADADEIAADPFRFATEIAERFNCAVLQKGFPAVVAAPREPTLLNAAGHSGIATGGMGDTLAGVAGAMLALGRPPRVAAALALHYAGRAAELAGRGSSLLPRDVAEALPEALAGGVRHRELELPEVLLDLPEAY